MSTTSIGTISDYNILFVTHLASLIGTGLTCAGFPLMSPTVLSCLFNLLAAVSSLLLSILVGWDTLAANDGSDPTNPQSLLMSQALWLSPNLTTTFQEHNQAIYTLPFMEEMTLVSTVFNHAWNSQPRGNENDNQGWPSYGKTFANGLHLLQESLIEPIYHNSENYRCLMTSLGPVNGVGAMAHWRQEICLSPLGRKKLLNRRANMEMKEKSRGHIVTKWLADHGLSITEIPVLKENYWIRFYHDYSVPVVKALLQQSKDVLQGNKDSSWKITDNGNVLFTARLWEERT